MGTHTRTDGPGEVAARPPGRALFLLTLLLTATLVAWGVLVYVAIDFGGEARSGESAMWVPVVIATLGAAACLFTTLLLGTRILALLRGQTEPVRPQGGRRAAR